MKNKRSFLMLFILFGVILFNTSCSVREKQKPNIVFILVDDLGWKDLGCYGSEFYETPNLDAFSTEAILFTDAYSSSPVCSPSRAGIMTGKHPARVGITDWIPGRNPKETKLIAPEDIHNMPLEEKTLAETLKENGYKTFFAGKWHLGESEEYWPENQGFDINKGGHSKGSPPGGYYSPYKNPRLTDGPEKEYLTDRLVDESIQFMESSLKDPFFLFLSFYTVHTPIQGCDKYDEYFEEKKKDLPNAGERTFRSERNTKTLTNQSNAKYAAMVRSMDENVGRLLHKLAELGMYENTIIIFTSDNGGLSTNHYITSVEPLRGGKGWCYEGGIRVPLIAKVPGMKTAGQSSSYPVMNMDFYPTILELAGISPQNEQHSDGESIVSVLQNPDFEKDKLMVWHYPHYHGSAWTPGSAIRFNQWKLIEFYEEDKVELYDLSKDIEERNDLASQYPEKTKELRSKMHEYLAEKGGKYPYK
ncbi:MAG: sulfatase [Bacteroidetes bacterium]|nr:sulfatase [Bacteroidota bacterium]